MAFGHVVVTGASAGIGEAIAREMARAGASLTLVARRKEKLEALAKELGGIGGDPRGGAKTHIVQADLSDTARCCGWIAAAEAALGPIEVLVNNAGAQIVGDLVKCDPAKGEEMMRLDLFTPMRLTREVLPGMIARRKGTIVDVSSVAAIAPTPGMYYYNAAKAGLAAASESLRGELRGTGVHVVTVYPGPVDTAMARAAIQKSGHAAAATRAPIGTTEVLAHRIRKAIEKRRTRVIYPRVYGLARHFPNLTRWLTDRLTPKFEAGT